VKTMTRTEPNRAARRRGEPPLSRGGCSQMPTPMRQAHSRILGVWVRRPSFGALRPTAGRIRLVVALSLCGMFAGQTSARAADPVLAAVGDIACQPGDTANACEQSVTAHLVANHAPTAVAVLGDNQYASGLFSEFEGKGAYNATWGKFNPIVHPVPGNHEYSASSTADGYFKYFGPAAVGPNGAGAEGPNGSYSYDLGSWHLIALNSDCSNTGCSDSVTGTTSDAQVSWLNSDLAAHPGQCTLAYWHHPRFSASFSGDTPGVAPLWNALYAAHADVVLTGHDHVYERYAQLDPSRSATVNGIREFVVGTGGESLFAKTAAEATDPTLQSVDTSDFGVLFLTLHPASYDWKFVTIDGTTVDSGSTACHAQPAPITTTSSTSSSTSTSTTAPPVGMPPPASTVVLPPAPRTTSPVPGLTFRVNPRHPSLGSLRKHGLGVDIYCSRACDVNITARVRRSRRMVTIARYRETESQLPRPSTHLVLRGLWKPLHRLRVAVLKLTFVAQDAADHRVTISATRILRR
jgi:acid phosphatase type 7